MTYPYQHNQMPYQPALFAQLEPPISKTNLVAAADTAEPAEWVSARYGHINTRDLVSRLERHGFAVINSEGRDGRHGKHVVELSHARIDVQGLGSSIDRAFGVSITLLNSHDGSTRFRAALAVRDLDTDQQMIVCNEWGEVTIRHNNRIALEAEEATLRLIDAAPSLEVKLEAFSACILSTNTILEFTRAAMRLRWSTRPTVDPVELIHELGASCSLLNLVEHLQNRILGGGVKTRAKKHTRRIRPPATRFRIMQGIWALAEARLESND
jgi:Domain of unknown function (DUF932)